LSTRRRIGAWASAGLGLPALAAALLPFQDAESLAAAMLVFLLAVVIIAVLGGLAPAVVGAVVSFLLANFLLTEPYYTFRIQEREHIVELTVFIAVAVLVSVTVDVGARHRVAAERNRLEARLLSTVSGARVGSPSAEEILKQIADLFAMSAVVLSGPEGELAHYGAAATDEPALAVDTPHGLRVVAYGEPPFAEDRRLLQTLATAAAQAWEAEQVNREAARARELAETGRVRSAILAAVSHDLRTPLSGIKVAASTLRQRDVAWSADEQAELLATIEDSTDRLTAVVSNLLAMTRLQTDALLVRKQAVVIDEVVGRALLSLGGDVRVVAVEVPEYLPTVVADPDLLERVIANLVDNATRFDPGGVQVRAEQEGARVKILVTDHGPGVPPSRWDEIFTPFRQLDEQDGHGGSGLGLAIARGFCEAFGASLTPGQTPGGGLTMTVELVAA
jgi:K+-sensing histidine kinase KdpD